MKKYTSVLVGSCFLLTMGGNSVASEFIIKSVDSKFIIKDVQLNLLEENKVNNSKFDKEYHKIYKELFSYRELQHNWDGYGGIRPSEEIINTTKNFMNILENNEIINPKIMVSGTGEIGLFWKNKDNYIEVDFDENEYFTYFYKIDNKIYGEDDIPLNQNIPNRLLYVLKNQNTTKNSSSLIHHLDSTTSNFLTV